MTLALVEKDLPANVGEVRDAGWIPGLGRSPTLAVESDSLTPPEMDVLAGFEGT